MKAPSIQHPIDLQRRFVRRDPNLVNLAPPVSEVSNFHVGRGETVGSICVRVRRKRRIIRRMLRGLRESKGIVGRGELQRQGAQCGKQVNKVTPALFAAWRASTSRGAMREAPVRPTTSSGPSPPVQDSTRSPQPGATALSAPAAKPWHRTANGQSALRRQPRSLDRIEISSPSQSLSKRLELPRVLAVSFCRPNRH